MQNFKHFEENIIAAATAIAISVDFRQFLEMNCPAAGLKGYLK